MRTDNLICPICGKDYISIDCPHLTADYIPALHEARHWARKMRRENSKLRAEIARLDSLAVALGASRAILLDNQEYLQAEVERLKAELGKYAVLLDVHGMLPKGCEE